VVY
jgi:hypothetical protein